MKVVLQRVSEASVDVVNELGTLDPTFEPQQIGPGFMILVGVTDEDGDKQIAWLAHKILNLRVFEDAQGKMNRSIQDIGGEILSIAQFTLFADVHKGNRPKLHQRPASPSMPISCGSSSTRRCAPGSAGEGRSFRRAYAGRTGLAVCSAVNKHHMGRLPPERQAAESSPTSLVPNGGHRGPVYCADGTNIAPAHRVPRMRARVGRRRRQAVSVPRKPPATRCCSACSVH